METKNTKFFKQKLSTLVFLVLFVSVILFVSVSVSGFIANLFADIGILPHIVDANRIRFGFMFTVIISVLIGTIIATLGGSYLLRPLSRLDEATKEVASGNFNVCVKIEGSKEIALLAENFNEMVLKLASVEALRADFVNTVSHEFKTPIASIKGFACLLKKNDITQEQRDEYLEIILSESERLTRLSGNILLLSKLESTVNCNEKYEFYLDEQIRKTILLLEPQMQQKKLDVNIALEKTRVVANEEMLRHLWVNLLDNAIKFSHYEGKIDVVLKQDEGKTLVTISDTGIGMDAEVKKRIFEKFYQSDRSRATEGNGLGLSLVKRILELEGGKIDVDSAPGIGTSFTVYLTNVQS